jgi:hypothetical protein
MLKAARHYSMMIVVTSKSSILRLIILKSSQLNWVNLNLIGNAIVIKSLNYIIISLIAFKVCSVDQ